MFVNSEVDKQHTIVKFLLVTLLQYTEGTHLYLATSLSLTYAMLQFGSKTRRLIPNKRHDTNISLNYL